MGRGKKFSEEEDNFIRNNYRKGNLFLVAALGRHPRSISARLAKLKLKLTSKERGVLSKICQRLIWEKQEHPVDEHQFIIVKDPNIAYIMGFIWADGNLCNKGVKVSVQIASIDADILAPVFDGVGKWSRHYHVREGRKPQTLTYACNRTLWEHLNSLGYSTKDQSARNAIDTIPKDLRYLWYRGLFDGDGSFYHKKTTYINLAGPYTQNWDYVEDLFIELSIAPYRIERTVTKKGHRSSAVRISSRIECQKLIKYLYPIEAYDGIGLVRKFEKARTIALTPTRPCRRLRFTHLSQILVLS